MLFDALARFASDFATPDEPTVTPFDTTHFLDVVASPAAQRLAALRAVRSPLAATAAGPRDAAARVGPTVVGRPVDVDQLGVGDGLAALALLAAAERRPAPARVERPGGGGAAGTGRYLDRVFVLGLQLVPNLAERRDRSPASLHPARPRNAVTTTLHFHQRGQSLSNNDHNNAA